MVLKNAITDGKVEPVKSTVHKVSARENQNTTIANYTSFIREYRKGIENEQEHFLKPVRSLEKIFTGVAAVEMAYLAGHYAGLLPNIFLPGAFTPELSVGIYAVPLCAAVVCNLAKKWFEKDIRNIQNELNQLIGKRDALFVAATAAAKAEDPDAGPKSISNSCT